MLFIVGFNFNSKTKARCRLFSNVLGEALFFAMPSVTRNFLKSLKLQSEIHGPERDFPDNGTSRGTPVKT